MFEKMNATDMLITAARLSELLQYQKKRKYAM